MPLRLLGSGGDTVSEVSVLTTVISKKEIDQIVQDFVRAILNRFKSGHFRPSLSDVLDERAQHIFLVKLECYGRDLARATLKTVPFKRKRNAVKTILENRRRIVDEFITIKIPRDNAKHEQPSETLPIDHDGFFDRVTSWRNNLEGPNEHAQDFSFDQPGTWFNELRESEELVMKDFEVAEDTCSDTVSDAEFIGGPSQSKEYEAIHEHLVVSEDFNTLQSAFERVTQHYYGDMMTLI